MEFDKGKNPRPSLFEKNKLVVGLWRLMHTAAGWPWPLENEPRKMRVKALSGKVIIVLCIACFLAGSVVRSWTNSHHTFQKNGHQQEEQEFPIIRHHVSKQLAEVRSDFDPENTLVVHT